MRAVTQLKMRHSPRSHHLRIVVRSVTFALLFVISAADGKGQTPAWQAQVRKYAEAKDWVSAMQLVEHEIARAPQDMDVRAWRARVLAWSGRLRDAEKEYIAIVNVSGNDPDSWLGIAEVYLREGKIAEARQAINVAEELDSKRSDIRAARGRILRAAGRRAEAHSEFQSALRLDPASTEALEGLITVRPVAKHELQLGQDNDLLSYSPDFHHESASVVSQWTKYWSTSFAGNSYQRAATEAESFCASVTRRQPKWGALTVGGAVAHDNGVIPKSEAFFDLDHGWKTGVTGLVRGVEFDYAQHWYWYRSARILAVSGTTLVYLPADWTFSLRAAGARTALSGTNSEWKPSGIGRLGIPLAHWEEKRVTGDVFFAAGTENFFTVDQIGSFASQTYGGGLRYQINARQNVAGFVGYQKRTQNRNDIMYGVGYGIHF